jgi:ATP-binding cassette subfamily B multidrug efflux pump
MDKGRIVETGTHAELVANGKLYSELWARQSGGFIADDLPEVEQIGLLKGAAE